MHKSILEMGACVPEGQSVHSVSPEVAAMRPFAHAVHCEAPGALTVPDAQLAH